MFKINHAILHVFDFVSCVNVFSQEELDLSDKNVKSYVQRVAKHALGNIDNKRGEFEAESGFKNELSDYLNGQSNFTDLSLMIAEFLGSELGRVEQPASCDLLVVDFERPEARHGRHRGTLRRRSRSCPGRTRCGIRRKKRPLLRVAAS